MRWVVNFSCLALFSVYGVTFIGARQQIQNALEDRCKLDDELVRNFIIFLSRMRNILEINLSYFIWY
jgi:hypothetical protein